MEPKKWKVDVGDLDDKTREQKAADAQEEMMDYLKQMIQFICTGDEKADKENIELLADGINDRALALHSAYQKRMNFEETQLRKSQI